MSRRWKSVVAAVTGVTAATLSLTVPAGAADPDGGSGGGRGCTGIHWNNGTAGGTYSQPASLCIGATGSQTMSGTTTADGNDYGDVISGREGGDVIYGGRGLDTLWGDYPNGDRTSDGADTIYGGIGNDKLTGGRGSDRLYGNAGADEFYTRDGYRDYIYCADSVDQAKQEAAKGYTWGVAGHRDYVQRDSIDIVDSTCKYAKVDSA